MPENLTTSVAAETDVLRWSRDQIAWILREYEAGRQAGMSQRAFAEAHGLPRSSLQSWLERQDRIAAPSAAIDFF